MSEAFTIDTPREIDLDQFDPDDTGKVSHEQAKKASETHEQRLLELQELLYGAAHQSILIVLQGIDTSGKDGTIRHVMTYVNPLGCQVSAFKNPTAEELSHDFLWRVHQQTPPLGMIGIFNRSHYEDVLVVRVHDLVPAHVWQRRYQQINHFERLLADSGTLIFKFFLHITKEEQKKRLLDREKDATKSWKLSVSDWQERDYWHQYQAAYTSAIGTCAQSDAPWYIIPANKKWYRNYLISQILVDRLDPLVQTWKHEMAARGKKELAAIQEFRQSKQSS